MSDTILIIDDCADFRETTNLILEDAGFSVLIASCPSEAFEILSIDPVDIIICDFDMPFINGPKSEEFIQGTLVGVNTIMELGWIFPDIPILALSAATDNQIHEAQKKLGDLKILRKPISPKLLVAEVKAANQMQPDLACN